MSKTEPNESDPAGEYREVMVEADEGRAVQVEEYPGGDMTIYKSGGKFLYLTSDQASALRSALGKIDGGKRASSKEDSNEAE